MAIRRNERSTEESHWTRTATAPARAGMSFLAAALPTRQLVGGERAAAPAQRGRRRAPGRTKAPAPTNER